jgi:hypothetical protein
MEQFLIYQVKVAVLLAVLFILFKLLMSKMTFHNFNRSVLLGILLLSFSIPVIRLTLPERVNDIIPARTIMTDDSNRKTVPVERNVTPDRDVTESAVEETASTLQAETAPSSGHRSWNWILTLIVVYCLGVAYCLVRKVISVREIVKIIKDGEYRNRLEGCDVIESDLVSQPVNWMRCIVMPREWLNMENKAVWQHEVLHAHKWHSLDLLLTDILSAVQYFFFGPSRDAQIADELYNIYKNKAFLATLRYCNIHPGDETALMILEMFCSTGNVVRNGNYDFGNDAVTDFEMVFNR